MKKLDVARAWRDEDYFLGLTAAERASLPENPAEAITVSDSDLRSAVNAGIRSPAVSCTRTPICSPCPPAVCP
jgi:mersacidin/lichenicidin family type 2 lantibiotic